MMREKTFLFVFLFSLIPNTLNAYVQEATNSGLPVAWKTPCITIHLFLGPPPVLERNEFIDAGMKAVAAWSHPSLDCSDLQLSLLVENSETAPVGLDHKNVIVFRKENWCRETTYSEDDEVTPPECYPPSALAVTSFFKNVKTGELVDADIEFNAVDYSWGDVIARPELGNGNTADFQNALTHELGHMIGLDHNCYTANDNQPRRNDHTGVPEVDCYNNPDLSSSISEATMYPSIILSDTERRSLAADDIQGVCTIYPYTHEDCPSGSGCSMIIANKKESGSWSRLIWSSSIALIPIILTLLGANLSRKPRRSHRRTLA
jgi:hypothetical protein